MHCLPMSHKKDAMLILVIIVIAHLLAQMNNAWQHYGYNDMIRHAYTEAKHPG